MTPVRYFVPCCPLAVDSTSKKGGAGLRGLPVDENGETLELGHQDCGAEPRPPPDDAPAPEILLLHALGRFPHLEVEVGIRDGHPFTVIVDPDRVSRDVRDGYLTRAVAELVHGVVLDAGGRSDAAATAERRDRIREERIGGRHSAGPLAMSDWRPALRLVGEGADRRLACGHCGGELCSILRSWKDAARVRRWDLAERMAEFGGRVHGRREGRLVLYEWACPHCGSLLETNLYPAGMAPIHDLRIGTLTPEVVAAREAGLTTARAPVD